MIALLSGTLALKEADRVVVKTASGVGYECFVPTRSLAALPPLGQNVELFTHLAVREDALTLFGFVTAEERRVFQRLITASGVGPKLALAMLSQLSAERIVRAIREHDLAALSSVSGVGRKTAERVVLELKDKTDDLKAEAGGERREGSDAATRALVKLGYSAAEADDAVRRALAKDGTRDTAELVKNALAFLTSAGMARR
jgi:Holliday junction DNA helicase RuvA